MTTFKKISIVILAALCSCALLIPVMSFADEEMASNEMLSSAYESEVVGNEGEAAETTPTDGPYSVTLQYYENVGYDDPNVTPDENRRVLLGERVITGLHEGDVLDTWDYVVDIPGHFFFDAWPAKLTVSSDPANNVIKLFYFKLWNYQYTVNYYLMEGADLTADTWAGALAPEGVEFIKLGSETFTDVRYEQLVKGDVYEYKIDGTYVVDTYPAQIRVGLDPDENVINVLYVPNSAKLPDDIPIPDTTTPEPGDAPDETIPTLPPDTTLSGDELTELLPDGADSQEIQNDFVGTDIGEGELVITDEMLANPVDREQAQNIAGAYRTGLNQGSLAETGDDTIGWLAGILAIAVAAAVALGCVIFLAVRSRNNDENSN